MAGDCSKCNGAMEPGFIVDYNYGAATQPEWATGEPHYSMWTGIRLKGRSRYKVITSRCSKCGFLESYATEALD
jgi:hypothetical protein